MSFAICSWRRVRLEESIEASRLTEIFAKRRAKRLTMRGEHFISPLIASQITWTTSSTEPLRETNPDAPASVHAKMSVSESDTASAIISAPVTPASSRRQRDPQHYLRFVEEGGTILLFADSEGLAFLTEQLGLEDLADLELESIADDLPDARAIRAADPGIEQEGDEPTEGEPARTVVLLGTGERLETSWTPDGVTP